MRVVLSLCVLAACDYYWNPDGGETTLNLCTLEYTDHPPRTKGIARRISNTCYEQLLSTFVYCFRVYVLRLVLLMCVCLLFLLFV